VEQTANNDWFGQINNLLLCRKLDDRELYEALHVLVSKLDHVEKMTLYSQLTENALANYYRIKDHIILDREVKEHLLYGYYQQKISCGTKQIDNELFDQLIHDYLHENYVALESIIIRLMKSEVTSHDKISKLMDLFGEKKSIKKQLLHHKARKKVKECTQFHREELMTLLEWSLYSSIEEAIEKGLVPNDALALFQKSAANEADRKHKEKLYQMAQAKLNNGERSFNET
jgi:hypothetical protein